MGNSAVQPCPQACISLCAEIAKVEMFQEEALLADAVYKPYGERDVPGFTEVTDPKELRSLGLIEDDLNPSDSKFRAGVFRKDGTNDYTVAFKGTSENVDWFHNAAQATTSRSDYYSRAKEIGRDMAARSGKGPVGDVKMVGHSLGGGLASAAAHATGKPATTFNSAGLHGLNRKWFNAPPIDAVRIKGEVLTALQSAVPFLAPDAVGNPYKVNPPSTVDSALKRADLGFWDKVIPVKGAAKYSKAAVARSVELHGMDAVNDGLKEQHAALKAKAAAQGCSC